MSTKGPNRKFTFLNLAIPASAFAAVATVATSQASARAQAPTQPTADELDAVFLNRFSADEINWCRERGLPDTLCHLYLTRQQANKQQQPPKEDASFNHAARLNPKR